MTKYVSHIYTHPHIPIHTYVIAKAEVPEIGHLYSTLAPKLSRHKFLENNLIAFSSVQLLSHVRIFATPWTTAYQVSLSITNSRSLPKLMSTNLVIPSNHLILCQPLLLPPSIFPSIRVFSNESALRIRWQKYWSFSFNISPSKTLRTDLL